MKHPAGSFNKQLYALWKFSIRFRLPAATQCETVGGHFLRKLTSHFPPIHLKQS
jgi:hypothetical protein